MNLTKRYKLGTADVYEEQPRYRTLKINSKTMYLYFPYMVYVLRKDTPSGQAPRMIKSLHVGCRTKPLSVDETGSVWDQSTLLMPPVPNIYNRWLLACSYPTIESFWGDSFTGSQWWMDGPLMKHSNLKSYDNWAAMEPAQVMAAFDESWPSYFSLIPANQDIGGTVFGVNGNDPEMDEKTRSRLIRVNTVVSMKEVLEPLTKEAAYHIEQVASRWA